VLPGILEDFDKLKISNFTIPSLIGIAFFILQMYGLY
jgi:hypothetical protein